MVRRFFLWQVFNLFERPGDRQFMIPIVVMVIAWIVAPKRAWLDLGRRAVDRRDDPGVLDRAGHQQRAALDRVDAIGAASKARVIRSTCSGTSRANARVRSSLAMAMLIAARGRRGRRVAAGERAAHALWIGWVLWFGVIESGITTNYLLLPIDVHADRDCDRSRAILIAPTLGRSTFAIRVGGDRRGRWRSRRGAINRPQSQSLEAARPTIRRRRHRRDSRRTSAGRSRGLHRRARLPDAGRTDRSLARAR